MDALADAVWAGPALANALEQSIMNNTIGTTFNVFIAASLRDYAFKFAATGESSPCFSVEAPQPTRSLPNST